MVINLNMFRKNCLKTNYRQTPGCTKYVLDAHVTQHPVRFFVTVFFKYLMYTLNKN